MEIKAARGFLDSSRSAWYNIYADMDISGYQNKEKLEGFDWFEGERIMELFVFCVFYGIVAAGFCFFQRMAFNKAKHMITKTLPISLTVLSFLLCISIGLIKIYMIKSQNYYIQMSVDEVEVMLMFYLTTILSAIIGCLVGIVSVKIFKNK